MGCFTSIGMYEIYNLGKNLDTQEKEIMSK